MRIADHAGRPVLVVDGGVIDVHAASHGCFGPDTVVAPNGPGPGAPAHEKEQA